MCVCIKHIRKDFAKQFLRKIFYIRIQLFIHKVLFVFVYMYMYYILIYLS